MCTKTLAHASVAATDLINLTVTLRSVRNVNTKVAYPTTLDTFSLVCYCFIEFRPKIITACLWKIMLPFSDCSQRDVALY